MTPHIHHTSIQPSTRAVYALRVPSTCTPMIPVDAADAQWDGGIEEEAPSSPLPVPAAQIMHPWDTILERVIVEDTSLLPSDEGICTLLSSLVPYLVASDVPVHTAALSRMRRWCEASRAGVFVRCDGGVDRQIQRLLTTLTGLSTMQLRWCFDAFAQLHQNPSDRAMVHRWITASELGGRGIWYIERHRDRLPYASARRDFYFRHASKVLASHHIRDEALLNAWANGYHAMLHEEPVRLAAFVLRLLVHNRSRRRLQRWPNSLNTPDIVLINLCRIFVRMALTHLTAACADVASGGTWPWTRAYSDGQEYEPFYRRIANGDDATTPVHHALAGQADDDDTDTLDTLATAAAAADRDDGGNAASVHHDPYECEAQKWRNDGAQFIQMLWELLYTTYPTYYEELQRQSKRNALWTLINIRDLSHVRKVTDAIRSALQDVDLARWFARWFARDNCATPGLPSSVPLTYLAWLRLSAQHALVPQPKPDGIAVPHCTMLRTLFFPDDMRVHNPHHPINTLPAFAHCLVSHSVVDATLLPVLQAYVRLIVEHTHDAAERSLYLTMVASSIQLYLVEDDLSRHVRAQWIARPEELPLLLMPLFSIVLDGSMSLTLPYSDRARMTVQAIAFVCRVLPLLQTMLRDSDSDSDSDNDGDDDCDDSLQEEGEHTEHEHTTSASEIVQQWGYVHGDRYHATSARLWRALHRRGVHALFVAFNAFPSSHFATYRHLFAHALQPRRRGCCRVMVDILLHSFSNGDARLAALEEQQVLTTEEAARVRLACARTRRIEQLTTLPDRCRDPLMGTVMRFPVQLPISEMVVDEDTISQHLLTSPTDPFDRSPLQLADLTPLPVVRADIRDAVRRALIVD